MNSDQRKYLIQQVENTHKEQSGKIKSEKPNKPSLNNYIVAAFLDNTIKFNDIEVLREHIRNNVIKMGQNEILIKTENKRGYSWSEDDEEQINKVTVPAHLLFVIPQNYTDALNEYLSKMEIINEKLDNLEAQKKTIIMKIQIGSNAVLDKLVTQVDNIGDLNIMNSQFLLNS